MKNSNFFIDPAYLLLDDSKISFIQFQVDENSPVLIRSKNEEPHKCVDGCDLVVNTANNNSIRSGAFSVEFS